MEKKPGRMKTDGYVNPLTERYASAEMSAIFSPQFKFGNGPAFPFLWSVIGAALFVAVVALLSGGRRE